MFFIPGWLIALLTFPGVMLHEWAHKYFCERAGIRVIEVKYFQLGDDIAGYVRHDEPNSFRQSFFISFGPLLVNSSVAFALGASAAQSIGGSILQYLLLWLAISVGMHTLPSNQDASHVMQAARIARTAGGSFLFVAAVPLIGLLQVANALRIFWFDFFLAIALVFSGAWVGETLLVIHSS